jgi:hypothetical protein
VNGTSLFLLKERWHFSKDETDSLLWAGGDASGVLSVKNLYTALLQPLDFCSDNVWIQKLWKWPLQLKVKLFIWLAAKEKVLTWEALQKKGWKVRGCVNFAIATLKTLIIY